MSRNCHICDVFKAYRREELKFTSIWRRHLQNNHVTCNNQSQQPRSVLRCGDVFQNYAARGRQWCSRCLQQAQKITVRFIQRFISSQKLQYEHYCHNLMKRPLFKPTIVSMKCYNAGTFYGFTLGDIKITFYSLQFLFLERKTITQLLNKTFTSQIWNVLHLVYIFITTISCLHLVYQAHVSQILQV